MRAVRYTLFSDYYACRTSRMLAAGRCAVWTPKLPPINNLRIPWNCNRLLRPFHKAAPEETATNLFTDVNGVVKF